MANVATLHRVENTVDPLVDEEKIIQCPRDIVVDTLVAVSHLARSSADHYSAILEVGMTRELRALLCTEKAAFAQRSAIC